MSISGQTKPIFLPPNALPVEVLIDEREATTTPLIEGELLPGEPNNRHRPYIPARTMGALGRVLKQYGFSPVPVSLN
jgi:hypothetical protein